ncbi:ATP-binding protein [Roseiarcus sp.]|uniref:ATP-binding protein n=1 Tax=Roseiarcus sp. TaxID=1969460 RepID=UPI003F99D4E9
MTAQTQLKVTSHVGRDLLASAASFKNEAAVVWEYVVNSLQYVDAGVSPRVQVTIAPGRKGITISDNGRGMSAADLRHFFRMHGENLDRLSGRAGRGKFGTGKSAAFGIANTLRIDTVRNAKRNVVLLNREMIESSGGMDIPVQWEVRDKDVDEPNGTVASILDINLDRIKQASIIEYVERHLQAFRASAPAVAIDNHVCSYREPETFETFEFEPSPSQRDVIGDTTLIVKVAKAPLPQAEQGITVTAGAGNLVAIERAGIETKEFGNYLFGDVDVPALEEHSSPIQPYDPTRSLQLNPQHPVVAILLGLIGSKLEEVRATLVRKSKDARKTEQARRLAQEANKIAEILNEDFRKVSDRLNEIRAASARKGAALAQFGSQPTDAGPDDWVQGVQTPGVTVKATPKKPNGPGPEPSSPKPNPTPPHVQARGTPNPTGDNAVDPIGGADGKRRRPQGGFRVEYRNLGKAEERSVYDPAALTILINLDHPLVAAALGDGSVEDTAFRRLSYEIAFSEYAMGLGYEVSQQDPNIPADDLLYEVRSTLNRISTAAVALYR